MNKSNMRLLHAAVGLGVGIIVMFLVFVVQVPKIASWFHIRVPSTPSITLPTKEIVSNTLGLTEHWRWRGVMDKDDGSSLKMAIQDERLFLYSTDDHLYAFDLQTGNILWSKKKLGVDSVAADKNGVYIGRGGDVFTFHPQTGDLLWKKELYKGGRGVFSDVYPKGNTLETYVGLEKGVIHILKIHTGEERDKITYPAHIYFKTNDILLLAQKGGDGQQYMTALSIEENKILWERQLDPVRWPIIVDNEIIVKSGQIYALNIYDGEIVWTSPTSQHQADQTSGKIQIDFQNELASNIALGGNTIYAINLKSSIIGFDAATGKIQGTVDTPLIQAAPNTTPDAGGYFFIAASDKYVAAYYGDSQELIVFERTDVAP